MRTLRACLIGLTVLAAGIRADPPAEFSDRLLLQSSPSGYHNYRIPAAVVTGKGTVVFFCEARKGDASDFAAIDLIALRSRDGGRTWSKPQVLASEGSVEDQITYGNPCPVYDEDTGTLWCAFTRENQRVFVICSYDDGLTWAPRRDITAEVRLIDWTRYMTGPGHGLQIKHGPNKGRLVLPSYHLALEELEGGAVSESAMRSHMLYSDDHGKSWRIGESTRLGPAIDRTHAKFSAPWVPGEANWAGCECLAAELKDGGLFLVVRDEAEEANRFDQKRPVAWSRDGGETWTPLKFQPQLPDVGCEASVIGLAPCGLGPDAFLFTSITFDDRAAAARAKVLHGTHARHGLTAYLSLDGCRNWREAGVIQKGLAAYSDLAILPDGRILCFYDNTGQLTNPYRAVRLATFNAAWLAR